LAFDAILGLSADRSGAQGCRRDKARSLKPAAAPYICVVSERTEISLKIAARRALIGRCPCCGQGKLMRSYLKQVENCAECGESFGHIRADDAAPWLTIILVGHIFLPFAFLVNLDWMPTWAAMLTLAACFAGIALMILPRAKALFIAILWQTHAPGYKSVELVDPT
jgi:uncharacterized protein (DUF983 family)